MSPMLSSTAASLERYLDVVALRQRVTASNIANADTPGYRARQVDLHSEMGSSFKTVFVRESLDAPAKNDGNNVQLDREMQALAENVLRFTVASLLLQREIRGLHAVIREGRT